jgi:serine/threonine-protein kinase
MNPCSTQDARRPVGELLEIDAICDRFEAAWGSDTRPDLASFLDQAPPELRPVLFRDLINIELDKRLERGERPEPRLYYLRFPELPAVINSAFESRLTLLALRRNEARDDQAGRVTEFGPGAREPETKVLPSDRFTLGVSQGPEVPGYQILRELGRGGMGVVYQARQIALDRDVALKMIKSGSFASPSELARFQNEAEAVARLDHPNIVPIFEVGSHAGLEFFSMKLIGGTSLDRRLPEFATDPQAVARIVVIVAEAVHHAHSRGILHRDLKPANILLDNRGAPHITDFGLAKRIESDSELTCSGAPVGTPSYMSPEQAAGDRGSLSISTDVYGIGGILYALLTGRAPFAGTTLVETLDKVRALPPEPPSAVNKHVPRDLEIICLKCLEKDPNRRYSSALTLAEDLDRWQKGIPILARPVGKLTRAAMWCRRNKALASLALLSILALLGGLAGITWKWREASYERAKTEAVNELLTQRLLAQASPELDPLAKNLTVRELLDRAGAQLGGWLEGQPEVEARIRETLGGAYLALGQTEPAETHLRAALELDKRLNGPLHRDTLRAANLLASVLDRAGHHAEAEPLLRRNLEASRARLGRDDHVSLDAAERLGVLLWHQGKTDESEAMLRKNVEDRSRVLKPEHPDTLRSIYLLSRVLRDRRNFTDAEHFAYQYAHSVQCARGANHPDNILAITNQADVARDADKLAEAERLYRNAALLAERILGADHDVARAAAEKHARSVEEMSRTAPAR